MPFMTYQVSVEEAVRNAGRLLQEGGASAVKLEGGRPIVDVVRRLVDIGIPVMGHVGLQPQSVNQLGGYRKRGTQPQEADAILADAEALQRAGAFAIVLESVPAPWPSASRPAVDMPTIGIGAGPALRRPGARQPRHAGAVRRLRAVVREAVRATGRDGRRRGRRVRGRRAGRPFPEVPVRGCVARRSK